MAIAMTCRQFSNIDWKVAFENCALPKYCFNTSRYEKIFKREGSQFIAVILRNPSLSKHMIDDLLFMAVHEDDADSVAQLLKHPKCDVRGEVLDRALLDERADAAEILKNDARIQKVIILCALCKDGIGCVGCINDEGYGSSCCDPNSNEKWFCRACAGRRLCVVCKEYECVVCSRELADEYTREYISCTTCRGMACRCEIPSQCHYTECANYEYCSHAQCKNCAQDEARRWYQCPKDRKHVFCVECSPDFVDYDVDGIDEEKGCPACQNKNLLDCWSSDVCGVRNLYTKEEKQGWYFCSRNIPGHVFCPICNPTKNEHVRNYMVEYNDIDVTRCPCCQGYCPY